MTKLKKQIFSIKISPESSFREIHQITQDIREDTRTDLWNTKINNALTIDFNRGYNGFSGTKSIISITLVVFLHVGYLMVPSQDFIKYPSYWPEFLLVDVYWSVIFMLFHSFDFLLMMSKRDMFSAKDFFFQLLGYFLSSSSVYIGLTIVWIYELHFHPPFPFLSICIPWVPYCTVFTIVWFQQPVSNRSDQQFRNRYKWYVIYRFVSLFIGQIYSLSAVVFENIDQEYQPVLALALPVLRHYSVQLLLRIGNKARGENELSAQFATGCRVACIHALCLVIIIGSTATLATACLICLIDAVISLRSCINIQKLSRDNRNETQSKMKNSLQMFVMKETLEILIPITYCAIFCMVYYGPNANLFGGFKNDYWQYNELKDISEPLTKLLYFLLVDIFRVSLNGLILRKYCKISLLSEHLQMMETYWKPITANMALLIFFVSNTTLFYNRNLGYVCLYKIRYE